MNVILRNRIEVREMRYRDLWQRLLSLYDEREAKAIVRLVLEERFGLTLAEMLGAGRQASLRSR